MAFIRFITLPFNHPFATLLFNWTGFICISSSDNLSIEFCLKVMYKYNLVFCHSLGTKSSITETTEKKNIINKNFWYGTKFRNIVSCVALINGFVIEFSFILRLESVQGSFARAVRWKMINWITIDYRLLKETSCLAPSLWWYFMSRANGGCWHVLQKFIWRVYWEVLWLLLLMYC